jgi:tetratricopeptide (TPR) repeat protein
MRGIFAVFILLLVLMISAQCQQPAKSWTITGFDLSNSAKYNKAINNGLNFYYQGKYDEAIKSYDDAIRLDPNSTQTWQAWNGKGDAFYNQNKYNEALLAYDKAILLLPNNGLVWSGKGDALKALGRINESETAYAKSKELGFISLTKRHEKQTITLNGRPIDMPDTNITTAINKGLDLYNQGKYDQAIKSYDDAIQLDPNNPDTWQAWNGKGDALKALGRTSESDVAYTTARAIRKEQATTVNTSATDITHILDHSMGSIVDEPTSSVIKRTYNFSTADRKVYSWLSLGDVGAGSIKWFWYSPDGNLFKTGFVDIPPNPKGDRKSVV